jgi:DNA processing protein
MPDSDPSVYQPALLGAAPVPASPRSANPPAGALGEAELACWVAFTRVRGIGPMRFGRLLSYFGSAEAAWRAGSSDLLASGLDARCTEALLAQRAKAPPEAEMERLTRAHVEAIALPDPRYPALLSEIYLPPPVFFLRGTLAPSDAWSVAIVGTRKASPYGTQVTETLAGGLARQQITVVSGLAVGIDTIAHKAALKAGGRTIAVLGSGVDVIYPAENTRLAAEIIEHGALLSEYPPGTRPEAGNFPARNRIVSGLARGVLVTEAPKPSGALITAARALEQNREVFAVPGPIPGSILRAHCEGTNSLIQQGAKLVMRVQDILEELQLQEAPQQQAMCEILPATGTEAALLALLSGAAEPQHIDELCRAAALPTGEVASTLVMMELKGLVRQVSPMTYAPAR